MYGERWRHHRLWVVEAGPGSGAAGSGAAGAEPRVLWAPDHHLSDLAWSPDGSRAGRARQAQPAAGAPPHHPDRPATLGPDGAEADATSVCPAPGAGSLGWGGDALLVFAAPHEAEPQSSGTAWAVPATGGLPRCIGTGPDEPRCTTGIVHAPGGSRTLLSIADGLANRLEWVDPVTGERTVAEDVPGDLGDVGLALTPDGPLLAVVRYDDQPVPRVLVGRPGALTAVSDHGAHVADVPMGTAEPLHATATDGVALDAVVIRPPGGGEGPWPTAVLVHGGPYGRSGLWSHTYPLDWGQLLAQAGYAVVLPNYRGGIGHGNGFATSVRGDMGGAEWGDVLAVVDAAVEAGIADPDRLGIGGWSQGGFLTAWAVTATDRFKVGVMGAGVSDWSMMAATSDLPFFEAALGGSRPWDGPGPHRAAAGSPISFAARRTTPLLILHGTEDARVPWSQAVSFHRALVGQDAPVELVGYPREPHSVGERAHQVDLQRRVVQWFDRYVGSTGPDAEGVTGVTGTDQGR